MDLFNFFVVDGNLAGDFEYLYTAIQYTINFRKGTYLLGKASSLTEANKRRQNAYCFRIFGFNYSYSST